MLYTVSHPVPRACYCPFRFLITVNILYDNLAMGNGRWHVPGGSKTCKVMWINDPNRQ